MTPRPPISAPAFLPSYHPVVVAPDGVCLLSEREHRLLHGRIASEIAPYLDGQRTASEIAQALDGRVTPAEVYYALGKLEQAGYLVDGPTVGAGTETAFWSGLGLTTPAVQTGASVRVLAFGQVATGPLTAALAELGLSVVTPGPATDAVADTDLLLALTDDYLHPGLSGLNAQALASSRPWLLAKPNGAVVWLGPLVRPGQSACWECLAHRLRLHREVEAFLSARTGDALVTAAADPLGPLGAETAADLVAVEVVKALAGIQQNMTGRESANALTDAVVSLDLLTLTTTRHHLTRRPNCPACGWQDRDPARTPTPPALGSRPKRFTADGGHRGTTPGETLRRLGHHISPITGIVSALAPVPEEDRPFGHVYTAAHNLGGRRETLAELRRWLATSSSGKGLTDEQARASGLCEALERHSGTFEGDEIRQRSTRRALGADAIDPNACMLFSDTQYRHAETAMASGTRFNFVPQPLNADTALWWSPLWSLTEGRFKHLPTEFLYYGVPRTDGARYCFADSNGCAAGNTLEEAILQGLLELCERDAVSIWWYNRVQRPGIDLDSFGEPLLDLLRRRHHEAGRELWALDLTADLETPVVAVLSRRVDRTSSPQGGQSDEIMFGFGAHSDARIALLRACTELNQFAASSMRPAPNGHPGDDPDHRRWWNSATFENQPFVQPLAGPARTRADFDARLGAHHDDLWADVRHLQALLERRGLEVLVLDQTRTDVGLPVVKVVVPGLRHYYARFAPGRLYDVPVSLGWLDRPTAESDLNPIPMFR